MLKKNTARLLIKQNVYLQYMRINDPIQAYKIANLKVGTILIAKNDLLGAYNKDKEFRINSIEKNWNNNSDLIVIDIGSFTIEKDYLGKNWETFFDIK
jgi:hypothetical protein